MPRHLIGLASIGLVVLGLASAASAKQKFIDVVGLDNCLNWCVAHNKTEASRTACRKKCVGYFTKADTNGNYNTAFEGGQPSGPQSKAPQAGARPTGGVLINP